MVLPEPVTAAAPDLRGPVLMNQDWRDLAFLHWSVDPERVRDRMPPGVVPDVLDGVTYVGLVPFRMVDAGPGPRRGVPWLGTFLETNVRLYSVDASGRRGVVFLSLDTDRLAVALGARAAFAVPYRWAAMSHAAHPDGERTVHRYRSRLRWPGVNGASSLDLAVGGRREPTALDHFVSDRWRLHTRLLGRTALVPNHHEPWPLHDAEVLELHDGLLASVGLEDVASRPPDHVAFSPGVHTTFGLPRRADRRAGGSA